MVFFWWVVCVDFVVYTSEKEGVSRFVVVGPSCGVKV
jgi:hypothetical protein